MTLKVMSGNYAQSYAAKLARVQVISAYPITPQTSIVEKIADFVASGELPAQYVKVESEHSASRSASARPPSGRERTRRPRARASCSCTSSCTGRPACGPRS